MTPKHRAVFDAISAVTAGMFLGSIKSRLKSPIPDVDLGVILRDLERARLVKRIGQRPPFMFQRVWKIP